MKKCKIEGCSKNGRIIKGYCEMHYTRVKRHGDPNHVDVEKIYDGRSKHPLYKVWNNKKYLCRNPKTSQYKDYGGRGLEMCDEWYNDFWTFVAAVESLGPKPSLKHTDIGRIENDLGYIPGNIQWETREQNLANRREYKIRKDNTSGYKGIYWHKRGKKWLVQIQVNGKQKYIGYFKTIEEAIIARDK